MWPQDKRTVLKFDRQDFGIGDLAVKVCGCEDVWMCGCVKVESVNAWKYDSVQKKKCGFNELG